MSEILVGDGNVRIALCSICQHMPFEGGWNFKVKEGLHHNPQCPVLNMSEKQIALDLRVIALNHDIIVQILHRDFSLIGHPIETDLPEFFRGLATSHAKVFICFGAIEDIETFLVQFAKANGFRIEQEVAKPLPRLEKEDIGYRLHYPSSTNYPEQQFFTFRQIESLCDWTGGYLHYYEPKPTQMFDWKWEKEFPKEFDYCEVLQPIINKLPRLPSQTKAASGVNNNTNFIKDVMNQTINRCNEINKSPIEVYRFTMTTR